MVNNIGQFILLKKINKEYIRGKIWRMLDANKFLEGFFFFLLLCFLDDFECEKLIFLARHDIYFLRIYGMYNSTVPKNNYITDKKNSWDISCWTNSTNESGGGLVRNSRVSNMREFSFHFNYMAAKILVKVCINLQMVYLIWVAVCLLSGD